jgi:hypothetical protein
LNKDRSNLAKPSLPLDVLVAIKDTDRKVKQLLQECHFLPDAIFILESDVLDAIEIMRVGVSESFKTRVKYYASQTGFCMPWLDQIADETVGATLALAPSFFGRSRHFLDRLPAIRKELREVLEPHIEEALNRDDSQEPGDPAGVQAIHSRESLEMMTEEWSWEVLAEAFKKIKASIEPLRADWLAYEASENFGVWLLRPGGPATYDVRATFGLISARAIEKLGILPVPTPKPLEHFPHWGEYCDLEEEMASRVGKPVDLSDAVPYGLNDTDRDAIDPCSRAWLEVLRKESPAFAGPQKGETAIRGNRYTSLRGTIQDVCGASAIYCTQCAREAIRQRLMVRAGSVQSSAIGSDASRDAEGMVTPPNEPATAVEGEQLSTDDPKHQVADETRSSAMVLFSSPRPVTIVRAAGKPEETRWDTRMGGDFVSSGLFYPGDQIVTCDELYSELFDEPRVVRRVDPVLAAGQLAYWNATIEPKSVWNRRPKAAQVPQLQNHSDDSRATKEPTPTSPLAQNEYPVFMRHDSKAPVKVFSDHEEMALGPEWRRENIQHDYPRWKYHWTQKEQIVKNAEEELALGGGWAGTPAAFHAYQGPRKGTQRNGATKWTDEWVVPGLTDVVRRAIEAPLIRADAAFWRSPDSDSAELIAMRQAFTGVAKVLSEAGILTEELLRDELPQFIWDSAIAGGWYRYASEQPETIFPEKIGHYWAWRDENKDWKNVFYSEIGEWRAWLVENPKASAPDPTTPGQRTSGEVAPERSQVPLRQPSDPAAALGDNPTPLQGSQSSQDVASETRRCNEIAAYIEHWTTDAWICSEASLARTARVDPADLSKWKKGLLPTSSDKKARIEESLKSNKPPTPPPAKKSDI